ncbi:MAG: ricin-type beta-trefoil lectin domain protein [Actinomycetota bacterium]|nr:ricin-type beta-trefoil lectin domain protein [Actinomycetota bacterium]
MRLGRVRNRFRTAIAIAATAAAALIVPNGTAVAAAPPTPSGWTPVWIEDFNGAAGTSPDPAKWNFDLGGGGWGNAELQNYTNRPSNVSHDGAGNLVITARQENFGSCWYGACTHTSGRILTQGKFTQQYGRIEARLRVPAGQGLWPAFWMLGQDIGSVGWPNSGEIDIMEILGHETNKTYGTIHGPGYSGAGSTGTSYTLPSGNFSSGFHTFRVEWGPDWIRWYVDDVHFATRTPADVGGNPWVFNKPFFIILNLAVGGNWPGSPNASTPFPAQYVIDYVATYQASTPQPPPAPSGQQIKGPGGKCVDIAGDDSGANGAAVQLWTCLGTQAADQHWSWNGTSLRTLGRCLDVTAGSTANGAKLQLWDCNGSGAQQWQQVGNTLRNPASGRCIDSPSGSTANGARLQIWDCNGSGAQSFVVGSGSTSGATQINGPGGKCVDVAGDDTGGNGAAVQLWTCLGTQATDQQWTWNGTSLRTLGRCLDVTAGSTANGAKLQLWDCNGSGAQQWQQVGNTLRNPASGRCIDSPSGSTANGARLQIWDCNGSGAQYFVKAA